MVGAESGTGAGTESEPEPESEARRCPLSLSLITVPVAAPAPEPEPEPRWLLGGIECPGRFERDGVTRMAGGLPVISSVSFNEQENRKSAVGSTGHRNG